MNCQSFENSLTDLARQHPVEATAMAEALEHGGSCSRCALRLEEQQALTVELRSLAEEMKTVQTPSHLESRLMEAFRGGKRSPQRTQATPRAWFGVAAVAAVILVVVGGVALRLSWAPPARPWQLRQVAIKQLIMTRRLPSCQSERFQYRKRRPIADWLVNHLAKAQSIA